MTMYALSPPLLLQLSAEYQSVSSRVLAPCEVCSAEVALSNLQQLLVECCTRWAAYWVAGDCSIVPGQLEVFACLLCCVVDNVSLLFQDFIKFYLCTWLKHTFCADFVWEEMQSVGECCNERTVVSLQWSCDSHAMVTWQSSAGNLALLVSLPVCQSYGHWQLG